MKFWFNGNKIFNFIKQSYIFFILSIIYIPLIFIVCLSFTSPNEKGNITNNFLEISGENYINLFNDDEFLNSLLNSFLIALVVVPISLFISIFTCIGIWTSRRQTEKYIIGLSNINISIPDIITGISLLMLFSSVFLSIGLNFGFLTIILSHISFCVPYGIITIYPSLNKINKNILNASMDLGYSKLYTYFMIIIPNIKLSIISAITLLSIMSFDDFIITSLVKGNIDTIGTAIYNSRKGIKAWIVSFGAIIVLIIFVSIFIASLLKIKNKKSLANEKK